jgi:hypothetical protein
VTHDLDQAERLIQRCAGRLVVILEGRLVADQDAARYVAARSFAPITRPGGQTP